MKKKEIKELEKLINSRAENFEVFVQIEDFIKKAKKNRKDKKKANKAFEEVKKMASPTGGVKSYTFIDEVSKIPVDWREIFKDRQAHFQMMGRVNPLLGRVNPFMSEEKKLRIREYQTPIRYGDLVNKRREAAERAIKAKVAEQNEKKAKDLALKYPITLTNARAILKNSNYDINETVALIEKYISIGWL